MEISDTSKKVTIALTLIMLFMFIGLFVETTISFRNYGLESVESKAKVVAETVKHGLTAHMVNGIMDRRKFFLEQIKNLPEVEKIWIARSDSVIEQYGKGLNGESAKDKIDEYVIKNGVIRKEINENVFSKSSFRITIPYIAEKGETIDCTTCHNVQVGEPIGAITIVMNIDDIKQAGIRNVIISGSLGLFVIIIVVFFVSHIIRPYVNIFSAIKETMQKANSGDYTHRIDDNHFFSEANEVARWINTLLDKLNSTINEIDSKVQLFLHDKKSKQEAEPLIRVRDTVDRLSELYKFRKTIELDGNIFDVYNRLSTVFIHKLRITHFNILETDNTSKGLKIVSENGGLKCNALSMGCRANTTSSLVDSSQFYNICPMRHQDGGFYFCIPYSISNDLGIIINIESQNDSEHRRIRQLLPVIQDYVEAIKPEIFSKKLMKTLEESAQRDPLTGLYNRKYLEDSISTIVSQSKRANISYGILMCDIDFFKMINDTYGHDVGDKAIRVIAETLVENTRESDSVIRYGGEEFLVLLYNCDAEYVEKVANKIRIKFSQKKISGGGETFSKTVSIGCSIFPQHDKSFWKCIKFADIALYKAKESGRNKVVVFNEELLKGLEGKY